MPQSAGQVRVRKGSEPESVEEAAPWARRSLDYARLAAIVYRNADSVSIISPDGWQRSVDPLDTVDQPATGLYLEVWERRPGPLTEVAIVFRGTNDPKDWWTNGRWATRFIPTGWDQYDVVRAAIDSFVARARARNPAGIRVIAAGHSLGGGLAQQAAYAHPDIKLVFAFDPSPVTGFRSVPPAAREANQIGIEIFRVYEKGEILAFLRGFLRRGFLPLSGKDPAITEVRFNLLHGASVTEHSMVAFTSALIKTAAAG
jgi:hypothetical protein